MEADSRADRPLFSLLRSFSVKLIALALVLLTVPLILYWEFQRAEQAQSRLLRNSATQTGRVIAAMLEPRFKLFKSESPQDLADALKGAAVGSTNVKVLVRPANSGRDDFIYVAAYPSLSASALEQERGELLRSGVFGRLAPTCDAATDLAIRVDKPKRTSEILTSMTPVHVEGNCWIVITSQNATDLAPVPLDLTFWATPSMRIAAGIYIISTALIFALFIQMWRNVARFRQAARRIRLREAGAISFRELNSIPELGRVAGDFDSLVDALVASQQAIKKAAEETAHALKAPLAVISQSIEPLKRAVEPTNAVARRSLQLIEGSVARLDALVTSARDLEEAGAEVVFPERTQMNLSDFLKRLLAGHEAALSLQGKRLEPHIADGIIAYANEELIETVVENLLDNAASYTPKGEKIEVTLAKKGNFVSLSVADHGPGVDPVAIPRIFDRYVSNRPGPELSDSESGAGENHQGLGLWIVKRNIEGLGGEVVGRNRDEGGFEVTVSLRGRV
jgi:two-component system sensor histidine kinase ChvG